LSLKALAQRNLAERIAGNSYPGRGLVVGLDAKADRLIQVYWIMGRSANSRNRVFETDGRRVWTAPADPAKVKDPSLIIYNATRELDGVYVVSNGDQTDTICDAIAGGGTFEQALLTRDYEPDAPNFTPRISGIFDARGLPFAVTLGLLRRSRFGDATDRFFWRYEEFEPGFGYCITTYMGDGDPLPAFEGEPYLVPLEGELCSIAGAFWAALDDDNKVSLCVKGVSLDGKSSDIVVLNKYEKQKQ